MFRLVSLALLLTTACGSDTPPDTSTDAGLAGNGGDAAVTPGGDPICREAQTRSDFAWLQQHVFTPSCATAMCHVGDDGSVGLRLEEGEAYNNLVNKGSSTQSTWTRVVPGSTTQSYLMVVLGRAPGPEPESGFMPLEQPALCEQKLAAIERWIIAGAPR
jgi:hypothetical protein